MEIKKNYKVYDLIRERIKTYKEVSTTRILAENDLEAENKAKKIREEGADSVSYYKTNEGKYNDDLISINETIEIKEIK